MRNYIFTRIFRKDFDLESFVLSRSTKAQPDKKTEVCTYCYEGFHPRPLDQAKCTSCSGWVHWNPWKHKRTCANKHYRQDDAVGKIECFACERYGEL